MRIRTIKPEFWTDATMVQLDPMARLLFIGLWNVADDRGYLLAEPERLAMLVLPREAPEKVAALLDLLIAAGRLERFEADVDDSLRISYLRITNWDKHQRVDKPAASKIAREGSRKVAIPSEVRRQVATKYGCRPGEEATAYCYYCGAPGDIKWWKTSTGKISAWVSFSGLHLDHFKPESKGGETTSENIVLACDHCNKSKGAKAAIPEFLARTREDSREFLVGKEGKGKEQGSGMEVDYSSTSQFAKSASADAPPEKLVEVWNTEKPPQCAEVKKLSAGRRRRIKARLREEPSIERWRLGIQRLHTSDFCRGLKPGSSWVADFDWLLQPDSLLKIEEGKYDNKGTPAKSAFDPNQGIISRHFEPAPSPPVRAFQPLPPELEIPL